jgi:uncharacterized membrane protein
MPAAETGQANTGLASPVVFGAGLLMLGLSPIIRGGNRHVALVLLEWLALLLLVALLARGLAFRDRADAQPSQPLASAGVWVLALSPLWVALVQLIPLPVSLWAALPGHAPYAEALAVAQAPAAAFRPLSLTPDITLVSVLAGLPLSAAFLLAFYSSFRQIGLLVHALVVPCSGTGGAGAAADGAVSWPVVRLGQGRAGDRHLCQPQSLRQLHHHDRAAGHSALSPGHGLRARRHAGRASRRPPHGRALGGGAVPPAVGRSGLGLARRHRHLPGRHPAGGAAAAAARGSLGPNAAALGDGRRPGLLALVALAVGVDALLARFEAKAGYLAGERWLYVIGTWHAALAFWPFGSGLGSYASVFPAFQPPGVHGFIEHAHNDYVQLLMECGLLAVALGTPGAGAHRPPGRCPGAPCPSHGAGPAGLLQASCGSGCWPCCCIRGSTSTCAYPPTPCWPPSCWGLCCGPCGRCRPESRGDLQR